MPVFQVISRGVQPSGPPKKRTSRVPQGWFTAARVFGGMLFVGGLLGLTLKLGVPRFIFILLPVAISIVMSLVIRRSQFPNPFHGSMAYGLLTICLSIVYFGSVTGFELITHPAGTEAIILVTTALTWAILMYPLYSFIQAIIERRFNVRDHEAVKAFEAFNSTLREEIHLDKMRDGLLAVVQQTMHPQYVSVWVRKVVQQNAESLQSPSGLVESGGQALIDGQTQGMQMAAMEKAGSTMPSEIMVAEDDPFIAYALSHPGAVEVDRLQLDSAALQWLKAHFVAIALPFVSQGELIGLLTLGPRLDGQDRPKILLPLPFRLFFWWLQFGRPNEQEYTREDYALLKSLAAQAAPALRVAQLVQAQQVEVQERERIEQELRTAQAIQRAFLPKDIPVLPGWQLVPYYQPAREVGGDFYDFLPLEDSRWGLVIGDVTGKGIPAALVMATVHTMLRTAVQGTNSPGEVLARVNDLLYTEIPASMFVTCFYAILDPANGRLWYANAGHEPPYRRHDGSATELMATGMPLGMMPGTRYEELEVTLSPGEDLFFYSDGLVEAHNAEREMLGFPRLQALLTEHMDGESLISHLLSELKDFTGDGWEQEDDVTLVTLQRTCESATMNEQQASLQFLGGSTVASVAGNEQQAMEWVADVVRPLHLPVSRLANLKTAVAEAVMNAMEHGNQFQSEKPVLLQVYTSPTMLVVRIRDEGGQQALPAVDDVAAPDLEAKLAGIQSPRGWGLFLIRNLVDDVRISGDEQYHVMDLLMQLQPLGPAAEQAHDTTQA